MATRQIVLDTETTGLDPETGHRIIEIACVEIINRRISDQHFHEYLNPDRDIDPGAVEVHGLTREFLASKPLFADIAESFLDYVRDAEVIIHNAPFDTAFIDQEFKLCHSDWSTIHDYCSVFDTLKLARDLHPGQRNSLDALCRRYEIDNAHRTLHGALLDAELLADVYLAMTGGQVDLQLTTESSESAVKVDQGARSVRADILVIGPNAAELSAHRAQLEQIDEISDGQCLWLRRGST